MQHAAATRTAACSTSGNSLSGSNLVAGFCMGSRGQGCHAASAPIRMAPLHAMRCMRCLHGAKGQWHFHASQEPGHAPPWARLHGSSSGSSGGSGHAHTHGERLRRHALPLPLTHFADAALETGLAVHNQQQYEQFQYEQAHVRRLYSSLAPSVPSPPPSTTTPSPAAAFAAPTTTSATSTTAAAAATSDNLLSRLLLTVLSHSLASQLSREGQTVRLPRLCTYDDFVWVSKAIMGHGRDTKQQELLIRRALNSVIPGGSATFRLLLGKNGGTAKWAAELNARFATLMFGWLVGEMELRSAEVPDPKHEGKTRVQNSVVHLKKCRYLEASGCVSACNFLCKAPTQAFFTEEAGLPTTLNPDFKTLSCDIMFGQAPPAQKDDPAFTQPCFATNCSKLQGQGLPSGHRAAVLAAAASREQ